MASGLVTLTFDYAAGQQFITHREHGYLAPLGDHSAFIDLFAEVCCLAPGTMAYDSSCRHARCSDKPSDRIDDVCPTFNQSVPAGTKHAAC